MPFHPNDLPAPALKAFNKHFKTPILWPIVVQEAVRCGVKDVNTLTDIVFYMHHWDRIYSPIKPGETKLINEWKGFRTLVQSGVPGWSKPSSKPAAASDWVMDDTEAWTIQKEWGKEVAEWAKVPPVGTEAKEFKPHGTKTADYKIVMAWKTADARKSCAANPKKRLQMVALLKDDWSYWYKRTGGSRVGTEALQTAAKTAIMDYREYVINRKICPPGAYNKLVAVNKDVTYELFIAMFRLLSPQGARPGGPSLKIFRKYSQNLGSPSASSADLSKVPDLIKLISDIASGKLKKEQS